MSRISQKNKEKIAKQIYDLLKISDPLFTAEIARQISRDEEFVKKLLEEMRDLGIVKMINQNTYGQEYSRRRKWKLADQD
jgi:Mn-dependent DtxR family transcriptional regulator